jgi:hypothetical protein
MRYEGNLSNIHFHRDRLWTPQRINRTTKVKLAFLTPVGRANPQGNHPMPDEMAPELTLAPVPIHTGRNGESFSENTYRAETPAAHR